MTNLEKSLSLDKKKAEKVMDALIYKESADIVSAFATAAKEGSFQHGAYLLDRAFGKARQNIGLDGGIDGSPIVFMPSTLVNKFALDKPLEAQQVEEPNIYEAKE